MKKNFKNRVISVLLVFAMLCSFVVPATATNANGVSWNPTDNSSVLDPLRPEQVERQQNTVTYADDEVVRVSIVLSQKPTLQAGFDTQGVASNAEAMNYRAGLRNQQAAVTARIENTLGHQLDVVWNLTLAANLISANVQYGQIKAIEQIAGVQQVVVETRYYPAEAEGESVAQPNMMVSANMTGATQVWETGYTGGGTRIAVIDTGLDTDHQSFDPAAYLYALQKNAERAGVTYEEYVAGLDLLDAKEVAEKLTQLNVAERNPELTAEDLYFNEKAPFGYNYLDGDVDITHDNDTQGSHGSHVAGISTANRYLMQDGEYVAAADAIAMQGNAPDAQVIVLKVFGKLGGCYESDYMAAIEDAIVLDCDAINLSLGESSAGFTAPSSPYRELMNYLVETESVVAIAAGNAGYWAVYSSGATPNLYIEDVNFQTAGNPSTYPNAFTVASVENDGYVGSSMIVAGTTIGYYDGDGSSWTEPLASLDRTNDGSGTEYAYVFIDGIGQDSDYEGIDVNGKVVFVSRGETNFADKADIAYDHGAVATIIYNNEAQRINMMLDGYWEDAPCALISMAYGQFVKENSEVATTEAGVTYYTGKVTVKGAPSANVEGSANYTMSAFSSWGVPSDLSLKPEITAPGGNIFSVNGNVPETDQYELMSGTSMATPQISGFAALMKQAIEDRGLSQTGLTDRALVQSILMSTAQPLKDAAGNYYAVMQQGAGLVDIMAAVSADSYLLVDGVADGKVKVELGDDPSRTGVYTFTFTLYNLDNAEKTYTLSADMFTQDAFAYYANTDALAREDDSDLALYLDTATTAMDFTAQWSTGETVTVAAGGQQQVTVTLTLSEEQKAYLDTYYVNGAYVEAFVYANAVADAEGAAGTSHSIPVLGFYGNWTDPSMFEIGTVQTHATGEETRNPYTDNYNTNSLSVEYARDPGYYYYLGGNPVVADSVYRPERNAFNNKNGDKIMDLEINTIRNAYNSRLTVTNTATNQVLRQYESGKIRAPYYGVVLFLQMWMDGYYSYPLNWNARNVAEGDTLEFFVEVAPEYYANDDGSVNWEALGSGATLTIPLTMDSTVPVISDISVDVESGTLTVTASDNQYVAGVALYNGSGKQVLSYVGSKDEAVPGETYSYELDLRKANGTKFLIQVYDYAYNVTTYELRMELGEIPPMPELIAFDKEYDYYWTAFTKTSRYWDLSIYCETTPVVFNAATIYDHYVFACDTNGDMYVMPEGDLSDMVRINNIGVVFEDMAYNPVDDKIYGIAYNAAGQSALYTVDHYTAAITYVGKVNLNTNTLAIDANGSFYGNEFGTSKMYSYTLQTLEQPQYMLEVVNDYGETFQTMGTQGMEYDAESGKIVWISYYFEEKSWGSWDYSYLYEIDPTNNTYTLYDDMSHQLVALLIPQAGKAGSWADPTDEIMSFELSVDSLDLLRGYSARLTVNMLPWNLSNRDLVWSSADPTIADVNQYGLVTGLKLGTTTITVTSKLDSSFSDTIVVNVETLPITMEGVLLDEERRPVMFNWNLLESESWNATVALDTVLLNATKTADGKLIGLDSSARTYVLVDMQTGTSQELSTWDGQMYDFAYSKLFSDEDTPRIHMIADSMWLPAKDPANPYDTEGWDLFDYLYDNAYAFEFVAIAVGDIVTVEDQGNTYEAEELFLLDDKGYIWKLCAYFDGMFYNSTEPVCYSSNLKDLGWSPTRLDETLLTLSSMVVGSDGKLYFSAYTGNTSAFYRLTLDNKKMTCHAEPFATAGEDIWPAVLVEVQAEHVEAGCNHEKCEVLVENLVNATCTEPGSYDKVVYCTLCDEEISRESLVIPATGHPYQSTLQKAPDMESIGSLLATCAVCGETVTVQLPALNETDYTFELLRATTATSDGVGCYSWKETAYGSFTFEAVLRHEMAESDPQIATETVSAQAGNTVRVEMVLKNNPGLQGIMGQLKYDQSVLTLVDVENGTVLESLTWDKNLVWDAAEDSLENGVLCVLVFQVAEDAPAGNYSVGLALEEVANEQEQLLQLHVVYGTVQVSAITYGDVNGDGRISLTDVLRLRKFLANRDPDTGESDVVLEVGADVNGDGQINLFDVLRLRKFLASRNPVTGESGVVLGPQ